MLQSHGYSGIRRGGEDVPGLALAVRQTDRAGKRVTRVHLNRERLVSKYQLEQQGGGGCPGIGALEPDFPYCSLVVVIGVPGPEIGTAPRLGYDTNAGLLDYPEDLLVVEAGAGAPPSLSRTSSCSSCAPGAYV